MRALTRAATATVAPIWTSGFRPFFLAASLYGPVLIALWYGARIGLWSAPHAHLPLWVLHAHELLFGFAGALVSGVLLTALPSWTGAAVRSLLEASSRSGQPGWFEQPGRCRVFLMPLALPPRMLLLGAGPDASPVARLAAQLHWKVTVVDHRPTLTQASRFGAAERVIQARPETLLASVEVSGFQAAVVMTHQLEMDREYLRALGQTALPYIGLLGPSARAARLLSELGADAANLRERLHAPVGLDLGGRSPEAIALSIVAEILAFLHGRAPSVALRSSASPRAT